MKGVNLSTMKRLSQLIFSIFFAGVTAFFPTLSLAKEIKTLPAPTVLSPNQTERAIISKPLISGVTKNNTSVAVYIDNVFNGHATVKNHETGTASFWHEPFLDIKPGVHTVQVRAVSKDLNIQSLLSEEVVFEVEHNLPNPVLFEPVVNQSTTSTRPFIVGIAPSDTAVEIFIDGSLNGILKVDGSKESVSPFRYVPFLDLDPLVDHKASARAIDRHGKRSDMSDPILFRVFAEPVKSSPVNVDSSDEANGEKTDQEKITDQVVSVEPNKESSAETPENNLGEEESLSVEQGEKENEEVSVNQTPNEEEQGDVEVVENQEQGEVKGEAIESQNTNEESDESNETAGQTESSNNQKNNSVIGWAILALIIAALIWRGRKVLFGDGSPQTTEPSLPKSENKQQGQTTGEQRTNSPIDSFEAKPSDEHKPPSPPPPPPASSY